ncbi:hypothetical protein EDB83DRAFT_1010063 [Lactarius deliciosus]|nr:hypothetical protein EDB83DRAFT_1010063 [Lactarius deliciosus]
MASRARIVHRFRSGHGRTRGACTRTCASSGKGPLARLRWQWNRWIARPMVVDRVRARFAVRTETASNGARRHTARTAGKYDFSDEYEDGAVLVRSRQTLTTLALLQTFHAQTRFLLSRLAIVLPPAASAPPDAQLTPRNFLALALRRLSSLDARFVGWLAEYAGASGARLSMRRGWRDFLGGFVSAAVGGSSSASSS